MHAPDRRRPHRALPLVFVALAGAACERAREASLETEGEAPAAESASARGLVARAEGEAHHLATYHDFGTVDHGERLRHTFVLENTDAEPVTILSAQADCLCTRLERASWRDARGAVAVGDPSAREGILEVPSGAFAELTLSLDTSLLRAVNQDKLSILRVRTSSSNTPFLTFELRVVPERIFHVTPAQLDLGDVPQSRGASRVVKIRRALSGSAARALEPAAPFERFQVELEEGRFGDEPVWTLIVTLPPGEPLGLVRERIEVLTTDADGTHDPESPRHLRVDASANVAPDVRLYPGTFALGAVGGDSGASLQAELRVLVPGHTIAVREASLEGASSEHLGVSFEPVAPDESGRSPLWLVTVETEDSLPAGPIDARLRLLTDDEHVPEVVAPVTGIARE